MGGCGNKFSTASDKELSEQAQRLPLEERYEFYLKVYRATVPHRTTVAAEIATLGEPAWTYTIQRAVSGDYRNGLQPALPVLIAFQRHCTSIEYNELMASAKRLAPTRQDLRYSVGGIRIACGLVSGSTSGDYESDLNKVCREMGCS